MKTSVNWLKDFIKIPPPVERIADRLTMAGLEVKKLEPLPKLKDTLFEVEITTNRPDWLSHWGVAREIAAIENLSLKPPDIDKTTNRPMPPGWKIIMKDLEAGPYYTGVLIEGIEWNETPDEMKARLEAVGLRSINLIVDITNYVLLETGQPLHAFDADLLHGKEIQVRRAKAGEKMTSISETVLELQSKDLVIADSERAVALAGVMGGKDTEVTPKTRNIFLESAFFQPRCVRQTSRRLGLVSESSYRFERRVDPEGVDYGRDRAVHLIKQFAKPRFISAVLKAGDKPLPPKGRIHLRASEIENNLGVKIKSHQISSILTRLGFEAKQDAAESWNVKVPSFRADVTQPVDLIEEVARLYGYETIEETLPERAPISLHEEPRLKLQERSRGFFAGAGLFETVTFSLISGAGLDPEKDLKEAVRVVNPQNKELVWMRPVLLPSLLEVVRRNFHLGARGVPIFEIANVYTRPQKEKHPEEERALGIALSGRLCETSWLDAERDATFYDLKGLVEKYLESLGVVFTFESLHRSYFREGHAETVLIGTKTVGFLGEVQGVLCRQAGLEKEVHFAQLFLGKILPHVAWIKPLAPLPRFPPIERDLAMVVAESVKAGEVERMLRESGQGLIRKIEIFDLFRGGRIPKGCKNLAFRLTYQALDRTLVSEEIQKLHTELAEKIAKKFQASFQ